MKVARSPVPFSLEWLDEHEKVVRDFLEKDGSGKGRTFNSRLSAFPKKCSNDQARMILEGILSLRAFFKPLLKGETRGRVSVTRGQLIELVDLTMALSGDWVEALMCQIFRESKFGKAQYAHLDRGREASAQKRTAEAKFRHAAWQEEAIAVWTTKPDIGVTSCARLVSKRLKLPEAQKTVADAIRPFQPAKKARKTNKSRK